MLELTRENIITVARAQIGVPFDHQGRNPATGLDCIGLVIWCAWECGYGVGHDFTGYNRTPNPATLLREMRRWFTQIPKEEARAGDILMMREGADPTHVAILAQWAYGGDSIIHARASTEISKVCEHPIDLTWRRLITGAYSIPGIR